MRRPAWATARQTSASSFDGMRPPIPFLSRDWVGCGIDRRRRRDVRNVNAGRNGKRRIRSRAEVVPWDRDPRNLLTNRALDGAYHRDLVGGHECVGITSGGRAASPPDSVHVILGLLRNVVVDDVGDARNVEATLSDVGRYEHANLA